MGAQEAEDRLVALEALTTGLIRTLRGAGVLQEEQVGALLDRVEEAMTGQPGATFAAQQLAAAADPQGPFPGLGDTPPEAHLCASFRRILYGQEAGAPW
ncbi:hypothetical protein EU555_11920 [Methylobacterium nonmethylotrophicum]|uniref:Uncharacterized protein n=2 Tax=Methylobacterium nonmethylotrophicum TaxID=1141884 RepID=A0A4Z0NTV4_9HYPH|nr:hypothetical protein EU555_11920 [Methylobacterium nonmethylotrophicum]